MTWPRWINIVLGFWLLIAPGILRYVDAVAGNNDRLLGLLIAISAVVALWVPKLRYLNIVLGVWLVIAPFVLGYIGTRAIANDIIIGVAVVIFAFIPSPSVTEKATTAGPGNTSGPGAS